ncbi:MAG: amidase [Pirellulales bacterium]|nr:amidase [Pirellulales bacterium]
MSELPTLAEAADRIRAQTLSPVELLDRCLDRIDRLDGRLRAWVVVDREAARRAAQQLAIEAVRGEFRGPLHGVPIGVKDIIDVAGLPTRAGSPLRENHVAAADAPVVAGLRRAGAVILGKTVTVEFACFDPSPSRNPWDPAINDAPRHTPGGSSSGSAVAAAAGMCLGALGTQTGGSLVRPSTYCGVATCKPTYAVVSRVGVVPVSYHFDHVGPIARRIADLELMMRCLPADDDFGPRGAAAAPSGELDFRRQAIRPPRLGTLGGFWEETADDNIRQATHAAIERLTAAGAAIVPVETDVNFSRIQPMHRRIMGVEAATVHCEDYRRRPEAFGPLIRRLLDEGLACSAVDYAAALAELRGYRRRVARLFDSVDALIVPSTHTTAPPTLETLTGTSEFQAPWSAAGAPVASIPSGLAADGLPAAVQIVGRYHDDRRLLAIAQWCETVFDFDNVPPIAREV